MPRGAQMGQSVGCWQTLAPVSWYISFSLPKFPFIFFWLFQYGIFTIFSCNVYEAFLYVFSSKTNVKNTPPFTCIAGLLCMLDASVSHDHECVCQAHSLLCDCARLLNILILIPLTSIKKPSSFFRRPSSSSPKPSYGICLMWMQSWTERWTPVITSPSATVQGVVPCSEALVLTPGQGVWKPEVRKQRASSRQTCYRKLSPGS